MEWNVFKQEPMQHPFDDVSVGWVSFLWLSFDYYFFGTICNSFIQSDFSTNYLAGKNQQPGQGEASNKCDSEGLPSINKHRRTVFVCTYIANVVSLT